MFVFFSLFSHHRQFTLISFSLLALALDPDRTCFCPILLLSYSIFEHHMHKNYRHQENKKKRRRELHHIHVYLIFWTVEWKLLNESKLLSYRILFKMSKSIFDLFISLSLFLSLSNDTTQKVYLYQNIKLTKKCDGKQAKKSQKDGQTCWMNFENLKKRKEKKRKIHQLWGEWFVYKWWWICHFIASFFFSLCSYNHIEQRIIFCCLRYYFPKIWIFSSSFAVFLL